MVEITAKLRPLGNSYGFIVEKALVKAKVLEKGKTYTWVLIEKESGKDMSWACFEHANNYIIHNNILGVEVSC